MEICLVCTLNILFFDTTRTNRNLPLCFTYCITYLTTIIFEQFSTIILSFPYPTIWRHEIIEPHPERARGLIGKQISAYVLSMGLLDVLLSHHGIAQSCIDLLMPQQTLYLLYRHALVDGHCGKRPAELVRMDLCDSELCPKFAQHRFQTAYCHTVMRFIQRNEKIRTSVAS